MADQPVLFPDVEAWLQTHLGTLLAARVETSTDDVYLGTDIPKARRRRMVLVRRDGGNRLDLTRESARVNVRVFGGTDAEAKELAGIVRALVGACADGTPVARVREMSGPVPVSDGGTRPSLRLMTFDLTVVGAVL